MDRTPEVAVIGGGPAGLMAAEVLAAAGVSVTVYERKGSLGRKFLMAGRGGLNLTHSEPLETFLMRYGAAAGRMSPALAAFPPDALRQWSAALGQETFVGSSGRVFPSAFKASPLLRAWQKRLSAAGVRFALRHDWRGWDATGDLVFMTEQAGLKTVRADAVLLALGGASWPRLGSDGGWVDILAPAGVSVAPLRPANCGFSVAWSDFFVEKFSGVPVKPVVLSFKGRQVRGEFVITHREGERGVEGGAIYALSAPLRDELEKSGCAVPEMDLRPDVEEEELARRLSAPHRGKSFSNFLRVAGGLSPVAAGLLREGTGGSHVTEMAPRDLARRIKACPLELTAPFSLHRAISSAGGIRFDALDDSFMLGKKPGVFAAGEMLDWEAPTGGYLLQGCFSTGVAAAHGILKWLGKQGVA